MVFSSTAYGGDYLAVCKGGTAFPSPPPPSPRSCRPPSLPPPDDTYDDYSYNDPGTLECKAKCRESGQETEIGCQIKCSLYG